MVRKSPGFDTIELTEKVDLAIAELGKSLPEGAELVPIYRQEDFIKLSIDNLVEALRDGAIMVSVILFLFLLNFRVTAITLTAIPLSLGLTLLTFDLFGLTVNSMTLGGLAVAVGMVVDDAIVDVEKRLPTIKRERGTQRTQTQAGNHRAGFERSSLIHSLCDGADHPRVPAIDGTLGRRRQALYSDCGRHHRQHGCFLHRFTDRDSGAQLFSAESQAGQGA
jgi:Cu/Ag efflux pump CusA